MVEHAPGPQDALTEAQVAEWGREIGATAAADGAGLFLCLRGDLGAGKSVLARAVARGAGVAGSLPSPTFNLVFGYEGRDGTRVQHLDLYRLEDPDEVWELGWRELGEEGQIVLVEWPERAETLLPPDRWEIRLTPVTSTTRDVEVRRVGSPAGAVPAPIPEGAARGTE